MPAKPSTLPVWATDGGTTVTPSGGQQAAGFAVNTKPPARWVNWLFNLLYQWIQYLNAPVGTGSGAALTGTGGSTSGAGLSGIGGATNGVGLLGQGTGSGAGASAAGGATGAGGSFTGGATSGNGVTGTAAAGNSVGGAFTGHGSSAGVTGAGGATGAGGVFTGGATSGAGVTGTGTAGNAAGVVGAGQGSGTGVAGTGGSSNGSIGVTGTSAASNGAGVQGTATGTGTGVYGLGVNGYGVQAESDTSSPSKAALRVVPQDADPSSSPASGDCFVHSTSGLLNGRKAGSEWARYVGKVKSLTAAVTTSVPHDTGNVTIASHSIPAGTLRAGSVIRVRIAGTDLDSGAGLPAPILYFGGVAPPDTAAALQLSSATNRFEINAMITLRAVGASVAAACVIDYRVLNSSTYNTRFDQGLYSAVDTTAAVLVALVASAGESDANIRVDTFTVDISD